MRKLSTILVAVIALTGLLGLLPSATAWVTNTPVAELSLCVFAKGINKDCHGYLTIKNISSKCLDVLSYPLEPGDSMSLGAHPGNAQDGFEAGGVYINREYYDNSGNLYETSGITISISKGDLDTICDSALSESHYYWTNGITYDALYHNCVTFSQRMWNLVAPSKLRLGNIGVTPDIPKVLKKKIELMSGHWTVSIPQTPRNYSASEVYYVSTSGELIPYAVSAPWVWGELRADGLFEIEWTKDAEITLLNGKKNINSYRVQIYENEVERNAITAGLAYNFIIPTSNNNEISVRVLGNCLGEDRLMPDTSNILTIYPHRQIECNGTKMEYSSGDTFTRTVSGATGGLGYAYWCQNRMNAMDGTSGAYIHTFVNTKLSTSSITNPSSWIGMHVRTRSPEQSYFITGTDIYNIGKERVPAFCFTNLSSSGIVQYYSMTVPDFCKFVNKQGGAAYVEVLGSSKTDDPRGEITGELYEKGFHIVGWAVDGNSPDKPVTLLVEIGDGSSEISTDVRRDDLPFDGLHGINLFVETNAQGPTRVRVTASNTGVGKDTVLYDNIIDFTEIVKQNNDCIISIDSPIGSFAWNATPEIAGWIVSNSPISALTAGGISGMADIDLTPTLRDASSELNNAGYGSYVYKQRFSYVIPLDHYIPSGTHAMTIQATFPDGSRSEAARTTFTSNALVIRDGTNMRTWFSGTPGGDSQDTFKMDEPIYVCYRLTGVETGWGVDTAHPDYSYTVRMAITFPNGTTRTYEYTNDENWILLPTDMAGDYNITISTYGDISVSPQTLSLNVPVTIRPRTYLWPAWSPNETTALGTLDVGGSYYGCYELFDLDTNRLVNQSARRYDYSVTLELVNQNGNVISSKTFQNADTGAFLFTIPDVGSYTLRLTANGNIGGLDASEYSRTSGFTVRQQDPYLGVCQVVDDYVNVHRFPAIFEQELGVPTAFHLYKHGWMGRNYDYRFTLNGDGARCAWVSGIDQKSGKKVLQVTALEEKQTKIALEVYDRSSGQVYATCNLYINGMVPTYDVSFDANGGNITPTSGIKRKGEAYKLPKTNLTYVGHEQDYFFRGWSSDPDAQVPEYTPGGWYTYDAPVKLYAVFERGDRYVYDTNGGQNGPESQWHSELLETRPFKLSSVQPTRLGYIFKGWSLSSAATSASYSAGSKCSVRGSHTFYAVWERNSSILAYGKLDNSFEWIVEQNNVLSLHGSGAMPDLCINYTTDHPWDEYEIHSIIVEEGITTISSMAFFGMDKVTAVTLPTTLQRINSWAFYGCKSLPTIHIPDSVTYLGELAFADCDGFSSFAIGDNITYIGPSLLAGCDALETVHLNAGMTSIPNRMFYYCTGLMNFTVPGRIRTVGKEAFGNCTGLTGIIFESGVKELGEGVLSGSTNLISVQLPDTVTQIGINAFNGCTAIRTLDLPARLVTIPKRMAYNCKALDSIAIPSSVTAIDDEAFMNCSALYEFEVPEGVSSIGVRALKGCGALVRVTLPNTVQSVGDYCFENDKALRCVYVPSANTKFGEPKNYTGIVFYSKSGSALEQYCIDNALAFKPILTGDQVWVVESGVITGYNGAGGDVTIPASLGATAIGASAFKDCTNITSVRIPAIVTDVGPNAFQNCSALRSVTISKESVRSIGDYAFYGCGMLHTINLSGVQAIGNSAFYNSGLTELRIPSSVKHIGTYCFAHDEALTQVVMEDGLIDLGAGAFEECKRLSSISLPDTLSAIKEKTFYKCSDLRNIYVPSSVTALEESAFSGCSDLIRVTLQSGLMSIGKWAFRSCYELETLELPNTLTSIGQEAFIYSGISYLTIPGSVTNFATNTFNKASDLQRLIFEPGITELRRGILGELNNLSTIGIPYTVDMFVEGTFANYPKLNRLLTGEGYFAEAYFKKYLPDVSIEYLWGPVAVTGIELNKTECELSWPYSMTLKATVSSKYARDKRVVWTSSAPEQISVDEKGTITALQCCCTAKITATTVEGGYQASCWVTVPEEKLYLNFFQLKGQPIIFKTVSLKPGMCFGELPIADAPGWTFTGWHDRDNTPVTSDTPIGMPTKYSIDLLADYIAGETLDEIVVVLYDDGSYTNAALPERFQGLQAKEGASVTLPDTGIAKISDDGRIIPVDSGITQAKVNSADGGWIIQPIRVVAPKSTMRLPTSLNEVEEKAFLNNVRVEAIYLPKGIKHIRARAFKGCVRLKLVIIPSTIKTIADDAFDTNFDGVVVCAPDSWVWKWCTARGIHCLTSE